MADSLTAVEAMTKRLKSVADLVPLIILVITIIAQRSTTLPITTVVLFWLLVCISLWIWRGSRIWATCLSWKQARDKAKSTRQNFMPSGDQPRAKTGVIAGIVLMLALIELLALIISTLLFVYFSLSNLNPLKVELAVYFNNLPPMNCNIPDAPNTPRVVIATFHQVSNISLIEDRLRDNLTDPKISLNNPFQVCRLDKVLSIRDDARAMAQTTQAAILIWGRNDGVYDVHLEVEALPTDHTAATPPPVDIEKLGNNFKLQEPTHLEFLIQLIAADLWVLKGDVPAARNMLGEALDTAQENRLAEFDPLAVAQGYFVLANLYDNPNLPDRDFDKAISFYQSALAINPTLYAALVNMGQDYVQSGKSDKAYDTFQKLKASASQTYVKAAHTALEQLTKDGAQQYIEDALVNLAYLDIDDRPSAEAYLKQLSERNSKFGNQIWAEICFDKWDDINCVIDHYKAAAAAYIPLEEREVFMSDIDEVAAENPTVEADVVDIKATMEAATPPP